MTYVDYLQEARVDMLRLHAPVAGGEQLAEGVVVVRHEVDYVEPLVFRAAPVSIEVWVTEVRAATFTLAYEIFDESPTGERTVYLRARSVLTPFVFADERPRRISDTERTVLAELSDDGPGPAPRQGRVPRDPGGGESHHYACHVRFSDVDVYRHVNNVKYFEYIQEARIHLLDHLEGGELRSRPSVVVAAIDVEYSRPMLLQPEPYVVQTWLQHLGTTSFTLVSEITDGTDVLARARARVVAVDQVTHRPVPVAEASRARLAALGR